MLRNSSYQCLCHPVCCKYLKAKWMEFGWKVYTTSFMFYFLFLVSLNVYAFGIPSYKASVGKDGNVKINQNYITTVTPSNVNILIKRFNSI